MRDFFVPMKVYQWLWRYLKPYTLWYLSGLGIVLIGSVMILINPWITGQFVENVILAHKLEHLWLMVIVMLCVTVFRTVIRYGMMMIFETVSQKVLANIRMELY